MNLRFLVKRFAQTFVLTFTLLLGVYVVQGQDFRAAAVDALLWAFISASIFVGTALYYKKTSKPCALCRDDGE
ncbi:MAG: hypothetical protein HYZ65_11220 [Burkholderiales bacterium]|nr:hypothetical protein [Burkholderiales bacterium]